MTIASGQTASADEVLEITKIQQVYAGAGFDSSQSGSAGTDEQDHELDAVGATTDSNFVAVRITGTSLGTNDGGAGSDPLIVSVKAQIKETGGAYGDIVAYKVVFKNDVNLASISEENTSTYEVLATLTAGMKTNGFQIKVFSKATVSGAGTGTASFTNIQTVQELRA